MVELMLPPMLFTIEQLVPVMTAGSEPDPAGMAGWPAAADAGADAIDLPSSSSQH